MNFFYCYTINNTKWVYDRYSNNIAQVDDITYDIFKYFDLHRFNNNRVINTLKNKYNTKLILKKLTELSEFQKKYNAFIPFELKKSKIFYTDKELHFKYNNHINHYIFNITENCNLRCKYCKFSGSYKNIRTHNNISMNYDVINKAIRFIKNHFNKKEKLIIGFYGGEPLLEFEKIKYIVENTKHFTNKINYSISTNGILLNEEMINFFIENRFSLKISIDGPREIHDRYRKKINNKPSFDEIIKNINKIKQQDRNYYEKHTGFLVTLAPPYQLDKIINFLESFILKNQLLTFNFIDPFDTDFFTSFDMNVEYNKLKKQRNSLEKEYIHLKKNKINNKRLNLLEKLFGTEINKIDERGIIPLNSHEIYPGGICIPGLQRLFISTTGNLGICEKTNDSLIIGNLDEGININYVKDLIKKYCDIVDEVCLKCWAYRLCNSCFISVLKAGKPDISRKQEYCKTKINSIKKNIKLYTQIMS